MNNHILAGAVIGTFFVDSNAALATWANNTPGYDFTSVFVKSGTWTSDSPVNLQQTGTKAVIGEGGSVLAFSCREGLKYENWPAPQTTREHFIVGITVLMINGGNAFTLCYNITGCHAKGNAFGMGYFECRNINNCSVDNFEVGFDNSSYITNCYADNCKYGYNEIGNLCNCQAWRCTEKYRYAENLVNCS